MSTLKIPQDFELPKDMTRAQVVRMLYQLSGVIYDAGRYGSVWIRYGGIAEDLALSIHDSPFLEFPEDKGIPYDHT